MSNATFSSFFLFFINSPEVKVLLEGTIVTRTEVNAARRKVTPFSRAGVSCPSIYRESITSGVVYPQSQTAAGRGSPRFSDRSAAHPPTAATVAERFVDCFPFNFAKDTGEGYSPLAIGLKRLDFCNNFRTNATRSCRFDSD